MFERINSHTFPEGRYYFLWKRPLQTTKNMTVMGLCEEPCTPKRTITIDPGVTEFEFLKTCVDESLHASLWALDNTYVDKMSDAIGSFLWRVGFRLKKD